MFALNTLCLTDKSFSKRIKKQTPNPLVYVASCLTAAIMDGQVLKILTLLASALPNHLINNIVIKNRLAHNKLTTFICIHLKVRLQLESLHHLN